MQRLLLTLVILYTNLEKLSSAAMKWLAMEAQLSDIALWISIRHHCLPLKDKDGAAGVEEGNTVGVQFSTRPLLVASAMAC